MTGPLDLDAATTVRPLPEVEEAMRPWLRARHADPLAPHAAGRAAAAALEEAREAIAALAGADPARVILTSGAAEAFVLAVRLLPGPVAASPGDPAAVVHPARERGPFLPLPARRDGTVGPADLAAGARLVALAHAHPELGAVRPLAGLAAAARAAGAALLVDASLTAGRVALGLDALAGDGVVLLALSFHRMGGPAGIGALAASPAAPLRPLLPGSAREGGLRAGLLPVALAAGAAEACRRALADGASRERALRAAAAALRDGLREVPFVPTGPPDGPERLPGHVSGIVPGADAEALRAGVEPEVLAGGRSPCTAAGLPSAALRASGFTEEEARAHLVLCAGPAAPPAPADARSAAMRVAAEAARLRALAAPWA